MTVTKSPVSTRPGQLHLCWEQMPCQARRLRFTNTWIRLTARGYPPGEQTGQAEGPAGGGGCGSAHRTDRRRGLAAVDALIDWLGPVADLDRRIRLIKFRDRGVCGGQPLLAGIPTGQFAGYRRSAMSSIESASATTPTTLRVSRRCRRNNYAHMQQGAIATAHRRLVLRARRTLRASVAANHCWWNVQ